MFDSSNKICVRNFSIKFFLQHLKNLEISIIETVETPSKFNKELIQALDRHYDVNMKHLEKKHN